MAISKTTTLDRIEILRPVNPSLDSENANDANYRISVTYTDVLDDDSDADLPVSAERTRHLFRYDANGDATNLGAEHQVVQDIAAAVWS